MHCGATPGPAQAMRLCCASPEGPEVDTLVGRTAMKTEVQVLIIAFLHRIYNFLRHPYGKGQIAAYLPNHYGCSNVPGLNLHMLPWDLLHHTQCVCSVPITAILRAICKRCWQFIRLGMVHLLINTLLKILEDDLEKSRLIKMCNKPPNFLFSYICNKQKKT
uniref:Uncharacterized protein n=1 Tax=Myripristis murdjan TaxID=586833 RepID=A0A667YAC6_9TELE